MAVLTVKVIVGAWLAAYLGIANEITASPLGDRVTVVLATVELPKLTLNETTAVDGS